MKNTLLLSLPLAVAACSISPTPHYDARFGDAVRQARQTQVLNPQPSADPVLGMDGKAAAQARARYEDTFKAPPPVVNVINIGSGGGGR